MTSTRTKIAVGDANPFLVKWTGAPSICRTEYTVDAPKHVKVPSHLFGVRD